MDWSMGILFLHERGGAKVLCTGREGERERGREGERADGM